MTRAPKWTTACKDWKRRLKKGQSLIPPPLFPEQAEEALEVFRGLRIVDAVGSPTFGESCEQWVFDLVASVFGAYDADSGKRLITEWFVLIPKKNGKSTIAAGIMMTALIRNWRQSAQFTILAPTIEVANNSFVPAKDMCAERIDEELNALLHTQLHTKTITHRINGAALHVLAAETSTVGGSKSVGTLVDEMHLFGEEAGAEDMLLEATGGLASRDEGFAIYLTTQSAKPPAGVFAAKLEYARGVRDGRIIDPQFVPILFEFPREMIEAEEHLEPRNWHIVNPNLGRSVNPDFLVRKRQEAAESGAEALRVWEAKYLNIQAAQVLLAMRWSAAEFWPQSVEPGLTLEAVLERSEVLTVGIDGGGLDDLLGLYVLGRERVTQRWLGWGHAWAHPIAIKRRKSELPRYKDFESDGDLTIIGELPGGVAAAALLPAGVAARMPGDVREAAKVVKKVHATGKLAAIGMDPEKTHKVMLAALKAEKIEEKMIFGVSQGWHLMGAATLVERQLSEGELRTCPSRLMAWAMGNAREEPRGNATLITKQASGKGKIDPVMALLDAAHMMALAPKAKPDMTSFLENPVIA